MSKITIPSSNILVSKYTCDLWDPNPKITLLNLRRAEEYYNDLLAINGYVSLYEVLEGLCIHVDDSKFYGEDNWVLKGWYGWNKFCSDSNHIDFGIKGESFCPMLHLNFVSNYFFC